MKKFRLLLAAMLAFVFNSGVWAQTTFTYGANTYEISSGTREVTLVEIGQGTTNADIPETVTYNSVPYTVTAITGNVVERCKGDLKTVKLPNTLKSFYGLDSNNRFISPFTGCTILTTVNMSNCTALTWLERNAFLDLTSLTTVQLPITITHIVDGAFSGCTNLKNINLSKLKQIDEFAFDGCEKLDNISLSSATIGENAFCDCKGLKSLSLTGCTLGQYAFSGCTMLQNLTMSGIVFISKGCFQDCVNLQSISLPASLCYMDENAFNGTELKHIYCTGSGVVNAHPRFYPDASDVTVHVPCGYASLYKKMSVWNNAAFTFKESGNLTLNVSAGESNGQVSVQAGSQTWTIPAAGGELTQTVEVPQNVKVTVPKQYFNKILVNGADMTSSLTSTVSGNNKTFTLTEFTETINIQVLFNTIPYDQLTFFFSGDNSVATTFEYGSTSTSVAPGTSQKTITGLTGISEVRAYFKTVNKPTVYHGSTNWSDRLEYLSSEGKYKLAINTSELATDVFTVVFPIPADAGTYITFADNTVKQLCISLWDENGDGKLSESEAAQVTSLLDSDNNSVFQGNQNITSFDEFKYFTGLTTIPSSAFSECKQLQSITLPATIRKIEDFAFYDCNSLKGITLPEGLTEIGEWVFCKTQMETFYLPKNVTSIGRCILSMNDNLISIVVSPENQKFDSRNGCNAIISKNVGSTPSLVIGCRYTIIPEDVVNISYGAFEGTKGLSKIILPASVNYIAENAFNSCQDLTSVVSMTVRPSFLSVDFGNPFANISPNCVLTVPAGKKQTYIDAGWTTKETDANGLFLRIVEDPSLNNELIEFADPNVKAICLANWDTDGDGKFSKAEAAAVTSIGTKFTSNTTITSFDELQYFMALTTLEQNAFSGCNKLTSIKFPSSLKTIKASAFQMCTSLKNITLPEGLEFLSGSTFVWCSEMTRLLIPGSVTSITGSPIIYSPNVSSIVVDDSNGNYDSRNGCNAIISTSTNELIAGCKNTIIPEDVVSIGVNAFFGNSGLTSIVLPSSITDIGDNAFNSCSSLKNVVCKMTTPLDIMTKSGVFSGINSNCVLTVPAGTKEAYINAGWTTDIFKGGIVEAEGDKLIALLAPGNGEDMLIINSEGDILYWGHETEMLELTKGGSYKVLVTNSNSYYNDLHLYVNGNDRTDELALDPVYNRLVLNLENVTENIFVKANYIDKQWSVPVVVSTGGKIIAHFTDTNGEESSNTLFEGTVASVGGIKPSTPITFTFQSEQGYELGLVFCDYNRMNTEEVQLQTDGTYQFVLPADQVVNEKTTVVALFKKTGTNPNYDVNGDGFVTITDAVLIVNEILGQ